MITQNTNGVTKNRFFGENILLLPDGTAIPYSFPEDKGKQRYSRTQFTKRFATALKAKTKQQLPLLHCWEHASHLKLIVADFDDDPADDPEKSGFANFDRLAQYLQSTIKHHGLVTRSASNKVKVFFPIEMPEGIDITQQIALDTLEKLLPDELYGYIDPSIAGLSKSYINESMFNEINSSLLTLIPSYPVLDSIDEEEIGEYSSCIPTDSTHTYRTVELNNASENFTQRVRDRLSDNVKQTDTLQSILLFLMATPSLASSRGFDISQKILSKTTGRSQKTMSIYLNDLVDAGLLRVTDDSFCPNEKAFTYRITRLFTLLFKLFFGKPGGFADRPPKGSRKLPVTIDDGRWNQTMVDNVWRFKGDMKGFWRWIRSIHGHDEKDRLKQAQRVIEWCFKKNDIPLPA